MRRGCAGAARRACHRLRAELESLAYPMPSLVPPRERHRDLRLVAVALGANVTGLGLLARVALCPEPNRVDLALTRLLQRRQPEPVTRAMTLISAPGFAPLQHVLTAGTSMDLWALGHRREALFVMLTMGAGTITGVIKVAVNRPRPAPEFMRGNVTFRDKSFPSGHCSHFAAFYGFLFYLARRGMPRSSLRTVILGTCAGMVVLVAPSRVYLGHHWSSDVVAGDLLGLTYLFALIEAYETIGVRRPNSPAA
jgi:membrane-associated phospholipid phosphatase